MKKLIVLLTFILFLSFSGFSQYEDYLNYEEERIAAQIDSLKQLMKDVKKEKKLLQEESRKIYFAIKVFDPSYYDVSYEYLVYSYYNPYILFYVDDFWIRNYGYTNLIFLSYNLYYWNYGYWWQDPWYYSYYHHSHHYDHHRHYNTYGRRPNHENRYGYVTQTRYDGSNSISSTRKPKQIYKPSATYSKKEVNRKESLYKQSNRKKEDVKPTYRPPLPQTRPQFNSNEKRQMKPSNERVRSTPTQRPNSGTGTRTQNQQPRQTQQSKPVSQPKRSK
jgi:hypothetical protein